MYNPKTKKVTRVYSCTFEETLLGIRGHPWVASGDRQTDRRGAEALLWLGTRTEH